MFVISKKIKKIWWKKMGSFLNAKQALEWYGDHTAPQTDRLRRSVHHGDREALKIWSDRSQRDQVKRDDFRNKWINQICPHDPGVQLFEKIIQVLYDHHHQYCQTLLQRVADTGTTHLVLIYDDWRYGQIHLSLPPDLSVSLSQSNPDAMRHMIFMCPSRFRYQFFVSSPFEGWTLRASRNFIRGYNVTLEVAEQNSTLTPSLQGLLFFIFLVGLISLIRGCFS